MGFGGWVRTQVLATRTRLVASVVALVLIVAAATTGAYAYFSDRTSQSAAADSGNLGVSVTASVQDEPFGSIINTLCVLTPTSAPCTLLKAVTPYQLTFTVTNNGTTPWSGDATLFDHFVNQGTEVGEKGMVQVYSSSTLLTVAQDILAGTEGDLVDPTTSDQSTMPDGSDMLGQTADSGTVTLAPGASKTFQYAAIFDPTSGTVESCSAPYTSGGKQVCDLQLTFGMTVSATSTYLGQQSGWTGSGEGDGPVTATITVNTPPVITATTTEDMSPFAGQIGASGQPSQSTYLAGLFTATDAEDGNLTSKITTSSSPAFDPDAAGTYSITGNVSDSAGASAAPVDQTVKVWNLTKVAAGQYHTLAIDSQGRVWAWGLNNYGQASGAGSTSNVQIPTLLSGLPSGYEAVDIAGSFNNTYVVLSDGSVYAIGYGGDGELGNGSTASSTTPVKVSLPVKAVQVSALGYSAAVLGSDGSVWTWGGNDYGTLGTADETNHSSPVQIIASGAVQVSQGRYGGAAAMADGSVKAWGTNLENEIGNGVGGDNVVPTTVPGLSNVAQVSYGQQHVLALTSGGQVYGWGDNGSNRFASGGTGNLGVTQITGAWGTNVAQVHAGWDYSNIVTTGGDLYGIGYNSYDSLLYGNDTSQSSWVKSTVASDVGMVAGFYDDSFYLNSEGTMVYGRGYGGDYSLGDGSSSDVYAQGVASARITLTNLYSN